MKAYIEKTRKEIPDRLAIISSHPNTSKYLKVVQTGLEAIESFTKDLSLGELPPEVIKVVSDIAAEVEGVLGIIVLKNRT